MGLSWPKVKVKPLNQMNTKDWMVAGSTFAAPIVKGYLDKTEGDKLDAKTKSDARDSAAKIEADKLSADYTADRMADRSALQKIAGQTIPGVTAASVDPFWAQQQQKLAGQLQAQANGQGPSLAQQQFQQASNTALQKSMGIVRGGVGSNPALAARTAALAGTNVLGDVAAQSGMARLKEQQDAQSALGALAANARTADMQQRGQDIGLGQSNAQSALAQQQLQAQIQGNLLNNTGQYYQNIYDRGMQAAQIKAGAGAAGKAGNNQLISTGLSTAGAVIGSIYGGPAGGAVGGAAGKAVGDQVGKSSSGGGMGLIARPEDATTTTPQPSGLGLMSRGPAVGIQAPQRTNNPFKAAMKYKGSK